MLSSVLRSLELMELLADAQRPLPLGEIARKLGISKSTAHEILATLAARNFVTRDDGGIYQLGLRAWEVGSAAAVGSLIAAATSTMERVAQRINEDVVLAVLSGFETINVHMVGSGQAVRVYAPVGTRIPANHASTGLLLLAYQADGYLDRVLPPSLTAASANTIVDSEKLRAELARVRARGHALNLGGWQIDVAGVAAPVLNRDDVALAALCVAAPRYRTTRAWMRRVIPEVVEGARTISLAIENDSRLPQPQRLVS